MTKSKSKMIKALRKWRVQYQLEIDMFSDDIPKYVGKSEITKLFNEAISKRRK
jgi:hypothetical protein